MQTNEDVHIKLPTDLTLGSLLNGLSRRTPFFLPASTADDASHLGWRLPAHSQRIRFTSTQILHSSAAPIVAFAQIRALLKADIPTNSPVKGYLSNSWLNLLSANTTNTPEWTRLNDDISSTSVAIANLENRSMVQNLTSQWAHLITQPPEMERSHISTFGPLLHRVIYEAILNVYEHAYGYSNHKPVWISASILPLRAQRKLLVADDGSGCSPEELGWIDCLNESHVLEVAISDHGYGIPRTLAQNARKHRPDLCDALDTLSTATRKHATIRAQLHAELCNYSFRHFSTRKEHHEFNPPFLRYHWRGLYRCYRQITDRGGCITVTSGQGRAGYAAIGETTKILRHSLKTSSDYPGTLWVIRLPIPAQKSFKPTVGTSQESTTNIYWTEIQQWDNSHGKPKAHNLNKQPKSSPSLTALTFPFCEIHSGHQDLLQNQVGAGSLLDYLNTHISQGPVPIISFLESSEDWHDIVRAFELDLDVETVSEGPPRLIGWLDYTGVLQCGFAGVFPQANSSFIRSIEKNGQTTAKSTSDQRIAIELHEHYPQHVTWNSSSQLITIPFHGATIKLQDHIQIQNSSWKQYWSSLEVQSEIVTEKPGYSILLPTGTRIRRHFSVFRMLHQSRTLCRAVGHLFGRYLHELMPLPNIPFIVIEQPASRHVCHALLSETNVFPEVHSLESLSTSPSLPEEVIVFADAILKGDTVNSIIADLRSAKIKPMAIIVCVDLRESEKRGDPIDAVPVIDLTSVPWFKPEILNQNTSIPSLMTDLVTNIPYEEAQTSAFKGLSHNSDAINFLALHPDMFIYGIHKIGNRIHTVSLPASKVLGEDSSKEQIINLVSHEILKLITQNSIETAGLDIVFFTRFDSNIGKSESQIAYQFNTIFKSNSGIFRVKVPAAYRDNHTVFPQPWIDPFADCKEMTSTHLALSGSRKPSDQYIAIYIDDASVTGNSIRDFVDRTIRVSEPIPKAIISIAITNRLSPSEVRFLNQCRNLQPAASHRSEPIKFMYGYIFQLPVRSSDGNQFPENRLLNYIRDSRSLYHPSFRDYLGHLRSLARKAPTTDPICHIFCPGSLSLSISAEAIEFRCLLSLHQQNEPVVLDIMQSLERLTSSENPDASLLTIFALEPNLLEDPPLRQFGKKLIISLAKQVIAGDYPLQRRSDALAVMSIFPGTLVKIFADCGTALLNEEMLFKQFLVHLIAEGDAQNRAIELPLLEGLSKSSDDRQFWGNRMITIAQTMKFYYHPTSDSQDAQITMKIFCSHLLQHAKSHDDVWLGFGESLNNLSQRWSKLASESRRIYDLEGCRVLAAFAKDVLIPAFPALIYFRTAHAPREEIDKMCEAHAIALQKYEEFVECIPLDIKDFTKDSASRANRSFRALKESTWAAWTSDALLGGDHFPGEASPLAKGLTKAFSAPALLLNRAIRTQLSTNKKFAVLDELGGQGNNKLTISPISVESINHIWILLVDNIKKCGDPDSLSIETAIVDGVGTKLNWRVTMRNQILNVKNPVGKGMGLMRATNEGRPYGVIINYDVNEDSGEYLVSVEIPNIIQIDQSRPKYEL